jgi:D-aspartate ligase
MFTRHTGRKMLAADDRDALLDAIRVCAEAGVKPLVQEIIPGQPENGANHIVYFHDGEITAEFNARKIRNWPVDWGSPCALVSERIDGLTERTQRLLGAAGYQGMACVEYKFDSRCSDYQLMEVNVRHNLSGAPAPRCGVDFPWIDYATRVGLDIGGTVEPDGFEEGVH